MAGYMPYSVSQVQDTISNTAQQIGVNDGLTPSQTQELTNISLATAQQESGFNPYAVSPHQTSYGVFQDNIAGGEGTGYTPQQLFNPQTSAQISISQIASVLKANPNYSPGQVAAAAQRPANPSAYAAAVNSNYGYYANGQNPPGVNVNQTFSGPSTSVPNQGFTGTPSVGAGFKWYEPWTWGSLGADYAERGAFIIVGAILCFIGLKILFSSGQSDALVTAVNTVASTPGKSLKGAMKVAPEIAE